MIIIICTALGITTDKWYTHTHTHTRARAHAHTEVTPNRPDIIIKNKK